jgi:hypothetical protein
MQATLLERPLELAHERESRACLLVERGVVEVEA